MHIDPNNLNFVNSLSKYLSTKQWVGGVAKVLGPAKNKKNIARDKISFL